jgi:DNA-binding transcriptional MerR regulator
VNREDKDRLAEALGAARVVDLKSGPVAGPLDMLALRDQFSARLRSSGGRPTDPSWNVTRQVPFKGDTWTRLQDLASDVGASGRRVGPAQVAAVIIENGLQELEEQRWQEALTASRALPLLSQPDAAGAAGVTYNQLDDWVQRGWLTPAGRSGRQRLFSADEVIRAHWLRSVSRMKEDVAALAEQVQASDLSDRYLVVTNAERVSTPGTRAQLYRLLEIPGGHFVIDQLPERRKLLGLPPFPDNIDDEQTRRAV